MDAAVAKPELKPVAASERIQALDVIRGFALLGIFLMNIEWFNRPLADLGAGMAAGQAGIDYAVAWFIDVFVRGKFWTMFSMLFGMGFAVMLARATDAQRGFIAPYLRRIAALAAFGLLHGVLIWGGDILLSYATAAFVLLLTLFGRFWQGLLVAAALAGVGFAFDAGQAVGGFVTVLAIACLVALYLRNERSVRIGGKSWPLLGLVLAALGLLAAIAGGIGVAIQGKGYAGIVGGAILLVLAWLSARFRDPPELRKVRAGAVLYMAPALAMLIGAAIALAAPPSAAPKPDAEQKQQIEKHRAEQRQEVAAEAKVMSWGTYAEAVDFRREHYLKDYVRQGGFTMLVLGLFLLGAWFVQSGAILHPERHAASFRKMVWIGLPLGLALAVVGHFIAPSHVAGQNDKPWQLAIGLQMVGNLPMSLGYIAAVVLLLQQRTVWARLLSWLAPAGRMALTNYLSQSVIASLFFYGYGLGHWGVGRAWQALFVIVVFALQLLISRWWLSRFRYGPMEWLWRWATYGRRPAMV
ncbi:MAG TPA: DUF418 domain-containing protein [Luteimonas sp.]|nr:DUF418 domain-containing protein [Luteimonas sp.]